MKTYGYLLRRLAWAPVIALGVVAVVFFTARIFGGDPIAGLLPNQEEDRALRAALEREHGLDRPLLVQFLSYLTGVFTGDVGRSMVTGRPVAEELLRRIPATLEFALIAWVLSILIGTLLGVLAAIRRNRILDNVIRVLGATSIALPSFWIGLVFIAIFSVSLGVTPGPVGRLPIGVSPPESVTGFYTVDAVLAAQPDVFWLAAQALILPVLTLLIGLLGPVMRVTRNAMVESLRSEYVRTARAFGHRPFTIYGSYALRNALLPVVTLLSETLIAILGGVIFIETIFNWPGVGLYARAAIGALDYPPLQGLVIYSALLYVIVYLLTDVLYFLLNPRTRSALRT